jgi:uncharacterized protein (DUF736 family)
MEGVKLMGLWKNKSRDGKQYFMGKLGRVKVLVFPNERKQAENQPDYNVFIVPAEKQNAAATADASEPDQLGRDLAF